MFASVGAACGLGLAQRAYKNADKGYTEPMAAISPPLYKTLFHKYYVDEIYDWSSLAAQGGDVRLGMLGWAKLVVRRQRHRRHGERRGLVDAHRLQRLDLVG